MRIMSQFGWKIFLQIDREHSSAYNSILSIYTSLEYEIGMFGGEINIKMKIEKEATFIQRLYSVVIV